MKFSELNESGKSRPEKTSLFDENLVDLSAVSLRETTETLLGKHAKLSWSYKRGDEPLGASETRVYISDKYSCGNVDFQTNRPLFVERPSICKVSSDDLNPLKENDDRRTDNPIMRAFEFGTMQTIQSKVTEAIGGIVQTLSDVSTGILIARPVLAWLSRLFRDSLEGARDPKGEVCERGSLGEMHQVVIHRTEELRDEVKRRRTREALEIALRAMPKSPGSEMLSDTSTNIELPCDVDNELGKHGEGRPIQVPTEFDSSRSQSDSHALAEAYEVMCGVVDRYRATLEPGLPHRQLVTAIYAWLRVLDVADEVGCLPYVVAEFLAIVADAVIVAQSDM